MASSLAEAPQQQEEEGQPTIHYPEAIVLDASDNVEPSSPSSVLGANHSALPTATHDLDTTYRPPGQLPDDDDDETASQRRTPTFTRSGFQPLRDEHHDEPAAADAQTTIAGEGIPPITDGCDNQLGDEDGQNADDSDGMEDRYPEFELEITTGEDDERHTHASFTNFREMLLFFTWDGFRNYFSDLGLKLWQNVLHFFLSRRRSYFWLHLIFWTFLALSVGGLLMATGVSNYADALFMSTSAISATGLATIDLSTSSTGTQVIIFFAMWVSGAVFESTIPLMMSVDVVREKHKRRLALENWSSDLPPPPPPPEKKAVYLCITVAYIYYGALQVLFFLIVGYFFQFSTAGQNVMEANNISAWWFSLFQIASAFNNCGFSLLPDSLMQIATSSWPLTCFALMVLLGNTAYPIAFRAILRGLYKLYTFMGFPDSEAFSFVLQNPRTYMTHLFPSYHTWLLVWALLGMTALQTVLLAIFSNNNPAFDGLSSGETFANMLFQSISVRTAGINTINIAQLNTSALILMIIMMYVSAYPVTILLRSSNSEGGEDDSNLGYQAKRMLIDDLTWVVLPWYLICSFEKTASFEDGFKILFEIVSAYGTVGLSMGLSYAPYSFSGGMGIASKLVMVAVMMMGRHRGMPDNIDGAIDINGVWEIADERFKDYTRSPQAQLAEELAAQELARQAEEEMQPPAQPPCDQTESTVAV